MRRLELSAIAKFELFQGLAPKDIDELLRGARTDFVEKSGQVFAQGEAAHSFFLLVDGFVRATKSTEDGDEITVRYVTPGEPFGVAAAIGVDHYPATAVAVVDAIVVSWPSSQWHVLTSRYPALGANALRMIGGRLQDAHSRLIELTSEEVEQRVARTLLRLARQAGRKVGNEIEIEIPLRRQDVAQLVGTTLHSASRVLSGWEQSGFVRTDRGRIILCNSGVLERISEGTAFRPVRSRSGH